LAFLLYKPSFSQNFGHFIWDDLLGQFALLQLFGLHPYDEDIQPVPLYVELADEERGVNYGGVDPHWQCFVDHAASVWNDCTKIYRKLYHELFGIRADKCSGDIFRTGNWLLGRGMIGNWGNHPKYDCSPAHANDDGNSAPSEYVLLPQVFAGTGRLGFWSCEGACSLGRGPQFWDFRNFLFDRILGRGGACWLHEQRPKGYITFSVPGGSSRPDLVWWFKAEIELARAKYGDAVVKVVDMAKLTIQEQARLTRNTAILLTNHGGGGAVSNFLDRGASVLVFWHGDRRMEHNFYQVCVKKGFFVPFFVAQLRSRLDTSTRCG